MIGSLGYLRCGDDEIELFNCQRTQTYLRKFSRKPDRHGCCPDLTPFLDNGCEVLDSDPTITVSYAEGGAPNVLTADLGSTHADTSSAYTYPLNDGTWWARNGRPESNTFWGFEAIRVGGLYQSTTKRDHHVSTLPCGDLTYDAPVSDGIELVFEGILHGETCCAVAYGYRALVQQLQNCTASCTGTRLRLLTTIPNAAPQVCSTEFNPPAETTSPWRSLYNVTVTEYPTIIAKDGPGCGSCGCSKATWVRFVLHANPGLFLDPITIITAAVPTGSECMVFCEEPCVTVDPFQDPLCATPILPEPPRAASSCFCPPVALHRVCYSTTSPDTMFDFRLGLRVFAGNTKALRNLRVRMWLADPGTPTYDSAVYTYCNVAVDIGISYVPVNGTWELLPSEGAFITVGSVTAPARQSLFTGLGQPRPPCVSVPSGNYIICVDADVLHTGGDADFSIRLVEIEPT